MKVQEAKKIVATLADLFAKEKEAAMALSDYLYSLYLAHGREKTYELAAQAGLGVQLVRQRIWIAEAVPMKHPLRKLPLSFCHLRVLAALKDADPIEVGKKAVSEKWSVAKLMRETKISKAIAQKTVVCAGCQNAFTDVSEIYGFQEPGSDVKPFHLGCLVGRFAPSRKRGTASVHQGKAT